MPIKQMFASAREFKFPHFNSLGFLLISLVVMGLDGCAKHTDGQPLGEALVKVNGGDVTSAQLNYLIRNSGDSHQSPAMIHNALETLVDQELVVQEALKAKLDTDPDVMQILEASRRQILADAYAQRLIYPKTPIAVAKQKAYYHQHPELFEKRRWYGLQVFTIPRSELDPTLLEALDTIKSEEGMRIILRARNIKFSERSTEQSAEQLPLSVVKQFAAAKVGDILVLPNQQLAQLMQIVAVDERPVAFEDAQAVIENYLVSARNREAMQAHIKLLRSFAQITYRENTGGDNAPREGLTQSTAIAGPSPDSLATATPATKTEAARADKVQTIR